MVAERAPYGRQPGGSGVTSRSSNPSYYGLPAVKKSHYRWLIVTYFFVGGIAGALQVIAAVADLVGGPRDRTLVRTARYLAPLGALVSAGLLILDLHTPARWYNMLRIFRRTSPMSIGSWTLSAFGALSGLAALGHALDDLHGMGAGRRVARWAGLAASGPAVVVSFYTGTLLAATSTPLWAAAYRRLPALFAASATSTAAATLSLLLPLVGAPPSSRRRLERLALVASAAQIGLALATERQWKERGVAAAIERQPRRSLYGFGAIGAGMAAPLLVHALHVVTGREWRTLSTLASVATLAGGYVERAVIVLAGNDSALSPDDYFRITQPDVSRELAPASPAAPRD